MIARLLPHPLLTLLLVAVWQMLVNYVSLGTLVFGLILGILIPLLTAPYWPDRPRLKNPAMIVEFILIVLWDIVVANVSALAGGAGEDAPVHQSSVSEKGRAADVEKDDGNGGGDGGGWCDARGMDG